jgi:hypothetical protein
VSSTTEDRYPEWPPETRMLENVRSTLKMLGKRLHLLNVQKVRQVDFSTFNFPLCGVFCSELRGPPRGDIENRYISIDVHASSDMDVKIDPIP